MSFALCRIHCAAVLLTAVSVLALSGCEPEFTDHICETDDDCFVDETCIANRCFVAELDAGPDAEEPDAEHDTDVPDAEPDVDLNECGGTDILDFAVGDPCGPCDLDEYQCEGEDLACSGATECPDLDLITTNATNIEATTATFNGLIEEFPLTDLVEVGFCWANQEEPSLEDSCVALDAVPTETGAFSLGVDGLATGTHYFVRAYTVDSDDEAAYGNEVDFTTAAPAIALETENRVEAVHLTWEAAAGATGYEIWADDVLIETIEDAAQVSFDDESAPAGTVSAPLNVTATDSRTDGIRVTWDAPNELDGTAVDYTIAVLYPDATSDSSEVVAGNRLPQSVTGYQIVIGTEDGMDVGAVTEYLDEDAPLVALTAGAVSASQGESINRVNLSTTSPIFGNAPTQTYKVRAFYGPSSTSDDSPEVTGQLGAGTPTYQWQRAAEDVEADYADFGAPTTATTFEDATPESADGVGRFYRVSVTAPGAETATSDAAEGWRAIGGTVDTTYVNTIGQTSATAYATVQDLGNPAATNHGFCYSENPEPEFPALGDETCFELGPPASAPDDISEELTGLAPGTVYYMRAFISSDTAGTSYDGDEIQFTTAPETPQNLSASQDQIGSIEVTWDAVPGVEGYDLYRDGSLIMPLTGTTYTDEDPALPQPDLPGPPPSATASTDDSAAVTITWDPAVADAGDNTVTYTVRADLDGQTSPESDPGTGQLAAPEIVSYEISTTDIDGSFTATDTTASHEDDTAPAPTMDFEGLFASQGTSMDHIVLNVDAVPTTAGTPVTYYLRSVDAEGRTSETSQQAIGNRSVGTNLELSWESDIEGTWTPLSSGITPGVEYLDTTAPADGTPRDYRMIGIIDGLVETETISNTITGFRDTL